MCESTSSSLSGAPILKISSCFKEAYSKTNLLSPRTTTPSVSSEETMSSSDPASARSSRTSSGYSGTSSLCECFEIQMTSKSLFTPRRERGSLAKLFGEPEETPVASISDEREVNSTALQPSLKMIRRLKRLSDAWSNACRCTDDIIIDRLKKGREEAIRKQTYIEELLNEASSQYSIQQQAHTLLQICPEDNDMDEIEAERIILLAGERYRAYQEEAERIVTDLGPSTWESITQIHTQAEHSHPATVYISNIKLKLSEKFCEHLRSSPKNYSHHFLCLLKEKRTKGIIATQILSTQAHSTNPMLHFSNRLTLPEIPSNFFLSIEVYHMSNENKLKTKKNRLSRVFNTVKRVPSLKKSKYLSCTASEATERLSSSTCSIASQGVSPCHKEDAIQSNFLFAGSLETSKKELFSSSIHEFEGDGVACTIELTVTADPQYPSLNLEGYLNVYMTEWERRWFVFNETSLKCWMYRDEPQQNDEPLCEWSLEDCEKLAYSASSEHCAWEYAFALPLHGRTDTQDTKQDTKELLLAAHSLEQEREWMTALNSIIYSNMEWRPCRHC